MSVTKYTHPDTGRYTYVCSLAKDTDDYNSALECLCRAFSNTKTFAEMSSHLPQKLWDEARKALRSGGAVFGSRATLDGPIEAAAILYKGKVSKFPIPIKSREAFETDKECRLALELAFYSATDDLLEWVGTDPDREGNGHFLGLLTHCGRVAMSYGHRLVIPVKDEVTERGSLHKLYHRFNTSHTPKEEVTGTHLDEHQVCCPGIGLADGGIPMCGCPSKYFENPAPELIVSIVSE